MGIDRTIVAGNVCYAGYGFFGTEKIRCPSIDVTLARAPNQSVNNSKYDSDVLNENGLNYLNDRNIGLFSRLDFSAAKAISMAFSPSFPLTGMFELFLRASKNACNSN